MKLELFKLNFEMNIKNKNRKVKKIKNHFLIRFRYTNVPNRAQTKMRGRGDRKNKKFTIWSAFLADVLRAGDPFSAKDRSLRRNNIVNRSYKIRMIFRLILTRFDARRL